MFEMQLRSASVRPGCGLPGQVDAQAVGRAQPGTLADEHHGERGSEQRRHLIADGHAACSTITIGATLPIGQVQSRPAAARRAGEPPAPKVHRPPRTRHRTARPAGSRRTCGILAQPAAQIRPPQIRGAVRRGAVHHHAFPTGLPQFDRQRGRVQPRMNRIARPGMRQLEIQQSRAWAGCRPRAPGHARRSKIAQPRRGSCFQQRQHAAATPAAGPPARLRIRARAAGSSSFRRYSASWKDVLW